MKNSNKNRAVLVLVTTLVVGFLSGAGAVAWFAKPQESKRKYRVMPELPDKEHIEHVISKYENMLDLTSEQILQFRRELDICAKAFNELNDELRPRYEEIGKTRRQSLEKLLSEEQLALYQAHREEHRKRQEAKKAKKAASEESKSLSDGAKR